MTDISMTSLRILADDLTGALDSAAPFASPERPVRLILTASGDRPYLTISSESRDVDEETAIANVLAAKQHLQPGTSNQTVWFKKVDSVLRGHPVIELVTLMYATGFRRCIFAPAFPDMGSVTRNGQHYVRDANGVWKASPLGDLKQLFSTLAPDLSISVPDIENQEMLVQIVAQEPDRATILWAGSRGLAAALAPPIRAIASPPVGLFILGTTHPATRAQAHKLREKIADAPITGAINLNRSRPLLCDPVPMSKNAAETAAAIADTVVRLEPSHDGSALYVIGGQTLATVLEAGQVRAMDCLGEIGPGQPLSRIVGEPHDGLHIVSKSGGFGDEMTLSHLVTLQSKYERGIGRDA